MYQPQTEIIHVGITRANSGAFTTVSMKLIIISYFCNIFPLTLCPIYGSKYVRGEGIHLCHALFISVFYEKM